MMTGKSDKEFSTFFLAFCGQQVTITTSVNVNMSIQDDHHQAINNIPLYYEGILMDYDEVYYYLGNIKEITQAVKIYDVLHITISEQKGPFDEFLHKMPIPNEDKDIQ